MATKSYLRKTLTGFEPADEATRELWSKYKLGEVYRAEIVKPRSYQHHKLCMALLSLTFANQERYDDFEAFRKNIARAAGHTRQFVDLDGEVWTEVRSLSYDELDELEFSALMPKLMTICAHILHDMDLEHLEAEVSRYADEHYGRRAA